MSILGNRLILLKAKECCAEEGAIPHHYRSQGITMHSSEIASEVFDQIDDYVGASTSYSFFICYGTIKIPKCGAKLVEGRDSNNKSSAFITSKSNISSALLIYQGELIP